MNETNVSTSQLEQKKCILISENKELKKENDTLKSQKEDLYEKNRENVDRIKKYLEINGAKA